MLLVATLGVGLGTSGMVSFNAGLFVTNLQIHAGVSRTQFGLAYFGFTFFAALAAPLVGMFVDRLGARPVILGGIVGLSACYLALGTVRLSTSSYIVLMSALGALGAASSSVGYTRIVNGAFKESRGLALGITQSGGGASGAIVPLLVMFVMARFGWQSGYIALGILALPMFPLVFLLVGKKNGASVATTDAGDIGFGTILTNRIFWIQGFAFCAMLLAFSGHMIHLAPTLEARGIHGQSLARNLSLFGISIILSRIGCGWMADLFQARLIGAAIALISGLGCLAISFGTPLVVSLGVAGLGCSIGAELDLLSYMSVRHFGLRTYGRVYAAQYGALVLMTGLGPIWVGAMCDLSKDYHGALLVSAGLAVCASVAFLFLPVLPKRWVLASTAMNSLSSKHD